MKLKSIIQNEKKGLKKIKKYQLPNRFKKIGGGLFFISFISTLIIAPYLENSEFKELFLLISKFGILVGLLLISISKEKIEDELITRLRMQSFTFSFIWGVIYALIQPFVNYFFNFITSGSTEIKGVGDFAILWILLIVQVCYFEVLKRYHNEK